MKAPENVKVARRILTRSYKYIIVRVQVVHVKINEIYLLRQVLVLRRWAQGTQAGVGRQLSANGVHVLGYGARVASYAAGCRLVRLVWGLGSPLQGQAGRREVSEMRRTVGSVTVSIWAPR